MRSLHDQVRHSVTASMQGLGATSRQVIDLVAYLHTLKAPPGIAPEAVSVTDAELLERGREVFAAENCGWCHVPPLTYTSDRLVDVGLVDEQGLSKFNPPSLRGVSQQTRFFHDGRAESLRAVFEDYGHQLETGLDEQDLQALVRFLQSL
jgi:cytochrome c peroxidase